MEMQVVHITKLFIIQMTPFGFVWLLTDISNPPNDVCLNRSFMQDHRYSVKAGTPMSRDMVYL